MWQIIRSKQLQVPLMISIMIQLSQQLSGITAIFYYSTKIFETTGLGEDLARLATIGVGVVMVVMTLVSIPLMDRIGRRALHLYGLGGMFISGMFLTISLLIQVNTIVYLPSINNIIFYLSCSLYTKAWFMPV